MCLASRFFLPAAAFNDSVSEIRGQSRIAYIICRSLDVSSSGSHGLTLCSHPNPREGTFLWAFPLAIEFGKLSQADVILQ
jgi:hypothetical protein